MNDNLIANHFGNNTEKKVYLHLENKMAFGYQEWKSGIQEPEALTGVA